MPPGWRMETSDGLAGDFTMAELRKQLKRLYAGKLDYFIVTPPEPVQGSSFAQQSADDLEISTAHTAEKTRLYGLNKPDRVRAEQIWEDYILRGTLPDMTGWELIGEFNRK